ncbi:hypothetical protein [Streptomyces sp. NPDC059009]|uniref:hypothetical protein n=1 Tax=Streptomyces sp. NPDC059009 TaxID=3346694 RepID=UPI00368C18AD
MTPEQESVDAVLTHMHAPNLTVADLWISEFGNPDITASTVVRVVYYDRDPGHGREIPRSADYTVRDIIEPGFKENFAGSRPPGAHGPDPIFGFVDWPSGMREQGEQLEWGMPVGFSVHADETLDDLMALEAADSVALEAEGAARSSLASRRRRAVRDGGAYLSKLTTSLNANSTADRAQAGQDYIDATIRKVLKSVSTSDAADTVSLDDRFTVTYLEKPSTGGTGLRRSEKFTLRQFALGAPYRTCMLRLGLSVGILRITPPGNAFPTAVFEALKSERVRSGIAAEFAADADRLAASKEFKDSFKDLPKARIRGVVAKVLVNSPSMFARTFAARWLQGETKERLVVFQNKVVPGLVAIGTNEYSLLVSASTGESYFWRKDDGTDRFATFISRQLSDFDAAAARPDDYKPQVPSSRFTMLGWAQRQMQRSTWDLTVPRISFRGAADVFGDLMKAEVGKLKSNLNSFVYSGDEQRRELNAQFGRAMMQGGEVLMVVAAAAMTGGAGAVAAFGSGLGFGFGAAHFDEKVAENADQGDVYRQAMEDAELGRILTGITSGADFRQALSAMRRGVRGATNKLSQAVRNGVRAAQENVHLMRMAPRARSVHLAAAGTGSAGFTGSTARGGATGWIAHVQEAAGVIPAGEATALRGVTPYSFEPLLGGAGKPIENARSLARLDEGYRVAFVVEENGRPKMIHSMLSLGSGEMAGVGNTGIKADLSPGFARVDVGADDVVRFSDDGAQLADGRRVKIYAETGTPEFRVEARRPAVDAAPLEAADATMTRDLLTDMRRNTEINGYVLDPKEKCYALLDPVQKYVGSHGFTDIRYRGMGLWDNGLTDKPATHFAVLADRGGRTFVFDLSAGQFANKGMRGLDGPLITTEANWAKAFQDSTSRKLIKYQDFATISEANDAFRSTKPLEPFAYRSGATVLTAPSWYTNAVG